MLKDTVDGDANADTKLSTTRSNLVRVGRKKDSLTHSLTLLRLNEASLQLIDR